MVTAGALKSAVIALEVAGLIDRADALTKAAHAEDFGTDSGVYNMIYSHPYVVWAYKGILEIQSRSDCNSTVLQYNCKHAKPWKTLILCGIWMVFVDFSGSDWMIAVQCMVTYTVSEHSKWYIVLTTTSLGIFSRSSAAIMMTLSLPRWHEPLKNFQHCALKSFKSHLWPQFASELTSPYWDSSWGRLKMALVRVNMQRLGKGCSVLETKSWQGKLATGGLQNWTQVSTLTRKQTPRRSETMSESGQSLDVTASRTFQMHCKELFTALSSMWSTQIDTSLPSHLNPPCANLLIQSKNETPWNWTQMPEWYSALARHPSLKWEGLIWHVICAPELIRQSIDVRDVAAACNKLWVVVSMNPVNTTVFHRKQWPLSFVKTFQEHPLSKSAGAWSLIEVLMLPQC